MSQKAISNFLKAMAIISWLLAAYFLLLSISTFTLTFGVEEKVITIVGFQVSGIIADIFPLLLLCLSVIMIIVGIKLWKYAQQ